MQRRLTVLSGRVVSMSAEVDRGKQALQPARPARKPMSPALWWAREFPGREEQVGQARGWLEELLPDCEQLEVLTLIVSELCTNAILHTDTGKPGGRFSFAVEWTPKAVKALVLDQGSPTVPAITVKADDALWKDEDGRGLFLVDQLADAWGTADLPGGRVVWVDMAWAAEDGPLLEAPGAYQAAIGDGGNLRGQFPGTTIWWGHRSEFWWAALPGAIGEHGLVRAPTLAALSAVLAGTSPSFRRLGPAVTAPQSRGGSRGTGVVPVEMLRLADGQAAPRNRRGGWPRVFHAGCPMDCRLAGGRTQVCASSNSVTAADGDRGSRAGTVPGFGMGTATQFPLSPGFLLGRDDERQALAGLLAERDEAVPLVAVIHGPPGVGKSALACRWMRETGPYSEGELYASFGPGSFESYQDVLGRWLRALGLPAKWIPADPRERVARWKEASAQREIGIIIDDVPSALLLADLIPGGGPAVVVATTRFEMCADDLRATGLGTATVVCLGSLGAEDAVTLLARAGGGKRVPADPDASMRLAELCGRLPLALRCAAGALALSPGRPVGSVADALAADYELAALGPGTGDGIKMAISLAYAALDPDAARAYRLLSFHPGPEIHARLAAAVLDCAPAAAADVLGELRRAGLLEGSAEYLRFPDPVREHARELADSDGEAIREVAEEAIVAWHLHHANQAAVMLQPGVLASAASTRSSRQFPAEFDSPVQALDWLEWERLDLLAVIKFAATRFPDMCWRLADAMWPLCTYRGHWGEALSVSQAGLRAARSCADPDAQARMQERVGFALYHSGRHAEAAESFAAIGTFPAVNAGTHAVAARSHLTGLAAEKTQQHGLAVSLYLTAIEKYEQAGDAPQAALAKIDLGSVLTGIGQNEEAIRMLREAADVLGDLPDPFNAARARTVLGRTLPPHHALAELQVALRVMETLDALPEQVDILLAMSILTAQAGHPGKAHVLCLKALELLPPWHEEVRKIRRALSEASDEEAAQ
jgi:anti-sigma regulatory factor (Ser/Thr protein kinase)/tetratricopeptide (TPR) repeat protein